MIAYLAANNLPNTAAALRAELDLGEDVFDAGTAKKYESLLEKKWTGIVRLPKKACHPPNRPFSRERNTHSRGKEKKTLPRKSCVGAETQGLQKS